MAPFSQARCPLRAVFVVLRAEAYASGLEQSVAPARAPEPGTPTSKWRCCTPVSQEPKSTVTGAFDGQCQRYAYAWRGDKLAAPGGAQRVRRSGHCLTCTGVLLIARGVVWRPTSCRHSSRGARFHYAMGGVSQSHLGLQGSVCAGTCQERSQCGAVQMASPQGRGNIVIVDNCAGMCQERSQCAAVQMMSPQGHGNIVSASTHSPYWKAVRKGIAVAFRANNMKCAALPAADRSFYATQPP